MKEAQAQIDLGVLVANWRLLGRAAKGARAAAVVKADGYGLGAAPIARALSRAGCTRFYVAHVQEGIELRSALGAGPDIAVLHGFDSEVAEAMRSANLSPVLNTVGQIRDWLTSGGVEGKATIQLDTGMTRLGIPPQDWADARALTPNPEVLMSHLACADEPGHPMNAQQLGRFNEAIRLWPKGTRSLAATAGIYLGDRYTFDEVRPGIGLYGGGPAPGAGPMTQDVARVTAPVIQTRRADVGEAVGYGATWVCTKPTELAAVALGYADGFLRSASNRGYGVLRGERRPVVGRVSMDIVMIDVSGLGVETGDTVEFLGPGMPLRDQAAAIGAADYELLVRLGQRVKRSHSGPMHDI